MLHRPNPVTNTTAKSVGRNSDPVRAAKQLKSGLSLVVRDSYRTAVVVLEKLHALMGGQPKDGQHHVRRNYAIEYRKAAKNLLAPIAQHGLHLKGTGENGFYSELYPNLNAFYIPFVEAQELHGAWMRYSKGIHFNVLGHKIHPFYGTYAPNRTEHLELFATWLSQYSGQKNNAVDVGTGCGILALLLRKSGFKTIHATDVNPNAIESVERELGRHALSENITTQACDLLGDATDCELILFNPPWLYGNPTSLVDEGLYFQDDLFNRFFDSCHDKLNADGRIVMVFSNILSLVQPEVVHPIQAELQKKRFKLENKIQRRIKAKKGHRRTREKVEIWELSRV